MFIWYINFDTWKGIHYTMLVLLFFGEKSGQILEVISKQLLYPQPPILDVLSKGYRKPGQAPIFYFQLCFIIGETSRFLKTVDLNLLHLWLIF